MVILSTTASEVPFKTTTAAWVLNQFLPNSLFMIFANSPFNMSSPKLNSQDMKAESMNPSLSNFGMKWLLTFWSNRSNTSDEILSNDALVLSNYHG
jgi:hypothetical protein